MNDIFLSVAGGAVVFDASDSTLCDYWERGFRTWLRGDAAQTAGRWLKELLAGRDVSISSGSGTALIKKASDGSASRQDIYALLGIMFSSPGNVRALITLLSDEQRRLWRRLLTTFYVSRADAEQIVGGMRDGEPADSFTPCALLMTVSLTAYKNSGRASEQMIYLYFYPALWARIYQSVHPELSQPLAATDAIDDSTLTTVSFEKDAVNDVKLLQTMFAGGQLFGLHGRLLSERTLKTVDHMGLRELPVGDAVPEAMRHQRARLLAAGMAMLTAAYRNIVANGAAKHADMVRAMVEKIPYQSKMTFEMILPYVSGVRSNDLERCTAARLSQRLLSLLKTAGEGWLPARGLVMCIMKTIGDYRTPMLLIAPQGLGKAAHYLFNKFTMTAVNADCQLQQFGEAYVYGLLAYMTAAGCLEAAYGATDRTMPSPYHGIRYVRLTPLGRYALHLDESYAPPANEDGQRLFDVDSRHLIVRSLSADNPYIGVLAEIGRPLYGGRYAVTAESFIEVCRTADDVERHIELFRQYVCYDLPPLWQHFFDGMRTRVRPVEAVHDRYALYSVGDERLKELIGADSTLRGCVIRCENSYVLVAEDKKEVFMNRLRKLGYIM